MSNIYQHILRILNSEKGKYIGTDVKILFAIESGSRLWGMNDEKSDYDVRFVYCYPRDYYLSLRTPTDNINFTTDIFTDNLGDLKVYGRESVTIDVIGFDIYKFMHLITKSNPNCVEWLKSDIVYYTVGSQIDELEGFVDKNINLYSLAMAYRGIGISALKKTYKRLGEQGTLSRPKKIMGVKNLLYALRGIIAGDYILHYHEIPPVKFKKLIDGVFLNKTVRNLTHSLIENKKEGAALTSYGEVEPLMHYLDDNFHSKNMFKTLLPEINMNNDESLLWLNEWIWQFLT
jgi:predicted nucleotidyltransferase